jgi:hypothetical protein
MKGSSHMKYQCLKSFIIITVTSSTLLFSMDGSKVIEFNNIKKDLIEWITMSYFDTSHPFSTTMVLRKTGNEHIKQGDILSLTEDDLSDIMQGKYTYHSYYSVEKTTLSHGKNVLVGAIILGTKDKAH